MKERTEFPNECLADGCDLNRLIGESFCYRHLHESPLPKLRPWSMFLMLWMAVFGYFIGALRFYDACLEDKFSPATCRKSALHVWGFQ